jgi:hypothetical protein
VIDSGAYASHDDLSGAGAPRVAAFVDFVNGASSANEA